MNTSLDPEWLSKPAFGFAILTGVLHSPGGGSGHVFDFKSFHNDNCMFFADASGGFKQEIFSAVSDCFGLLSQFRLALAWLPPGLRSSVLAA
jgi:hypothetical protein